MFLNNSSEKQPESNLIDILRPFILNCIVFKTKGVKTEWMTYRMVPKKGQVMIPDFVLYLDTLTATKFELFVVEEKKPGNFSNGHLETDLIKFEKEMQLALDKLIEKKVKDPEVVALIVEGYKVTTFKMDLRYNGQYRMIELSSFFVAIIQGTLERLYKAIQGLESEDHRSYRRGFCGSPVATIGLKCRPKHRPPKHSTPPHHPGRGKPPTSPHHDDPGKLPPPLHNGSHHPPPRDRPGHDGQ
ncbi:hypothetical protein BDF20DRAFT_840088 [Mycotypha africana]|uniref:uncharacterized protein n=1 Tax=Mycotypha africana TaxID=64632 RepID=UPI0022FFF89F|nr:uncharacterized protein BDF20DRAFT_840088 [Mycotypha africana]KAI8967535.1 hypothetical protein BDF20DRAFT_840088 [Mycotypha africana]